MTMPATREGGLMADFDPFEFFPVEIQPYLAAQSLELIELFSSNQLLGRKMDRFCFGLGRSGFHELLDQMLIEIQGGTHMQHVMHSPCICQFKVW
jgi:hypothetical protein